jgi:hypothetical protein
MNEAWTDDSVKHAAFHLSVQLDRDEHCGVAPALGNDNGLLPLPSPLDQGFRVSSKIANRVDFWNAIDHPSPPNQGQPTTLRVQTCN